MGVSNKQRRAAKQQKRSRARTARSGPRLRDDERSVYASAVWDAAEAVRDGRPAEARELLDLLDAAPPQLGLALADAVRATVTLLRHNRWTDDDLAQLEARRLKVPVGASAIERGVRWLALLTTLGPMPPVAPRRVTPAGDEAMLAKIRALLAKAESTTFPDEADALSAKAQELMARHRIDAVLLSALDGTEDDGPVGRRIWLDNPYAEAKAHLLAEVARANGCRVVTLGDLDCAHVIGHATDLDVVELLHTSLLVQATSALAAAGPQRDARGHSRTRSFRQSFLVAYAARIGRRLHETTASVTEEVAAGAVSLLPALVRRDARVEDVVARTFPGMTSRSVAASNAAGWMAGTFAADAADLSVGPHVER